MPTPDPHWIDGHGRRLPPKPCPACGGLSAEAVQRRPARGYGAAGDCQQLAASLPVGRLVFAVPSKVRRTEAFRPAG
jgi:hypothetical protein